MTAITWGHSDSKLFVAASNQLYTVSVDKSIPSLQALCQRAITTALQHRERSYDLVLPTRLKVGLAESFNSVIKVNTLVYSCVYVMKAFTYEAMWVNRIHCSYSPLLYLAVLCLLMQ